MSHLRWYYPANGTDVQRVMHFTLPFIPSRKGREGRFLSLGMNHPVHTLMGEDSVEDPAKGGGEGDHVVPGLA